MFPWDMDNTLGFGSFGLADAHPFRGVNESRFGNVGNRQGWWNRIKDSFFIAYPEEFLRMFYYLNNNVYDPDSMGPVIEKIASEGNQINRVNSMKSHINARYNYLNNFIEDELSQGVPQLSIENRGTRLLLQWPGSDIFSTLSSAKTPTGPWRPLSDDISFDGEFFRIILRPEDNAGFYRLSR